MGEVFTESEPVRRSSTILLVEDEEAVRQMTTDMLEQSGYTTLTATTSGEALAQCANEEQRIDLLLTDIIMPEMNGRELSRHIKLMRPEIKVLFMSGYTADILPDEEAVTEGYFIKKTFSLRTLTEMIEDRLKEGGKKQA